MPQAPPPAPEPQPPAPAAAPSSSDQFFGTPALRNIERPSGGSGPEAVAADDGEITLVAAPPSGDIRELTEIWPAFVTAVKADRIHVSALLQHTTPLRLEGETLAIAVPDAFHRRMLGNQREYLLEQLEPRCTLAIPTDLRFVVQAPEGDEIEPTVETTKEIDPYEYFEKKRQENPIIKAIFDDFGGEMVW